MARGNNQSQSTSARSEFSPYSVTARAYPMVWKSGVKEKLEKEYNRRYKTIGKGEGDMPADKRTLFEVVDRIAKFLKTEYPSHTLEEVFTGETKGIDIGLNGVKDIAYNKDIMVKLASPTNRSIEVKLGNYSQGYPVEETKEEFEIRMNQIADRITEYGTDLQEFNNGRKFIDERRKPKDDF